MALRFTDTNKWNDAWFSQLKPLEKLLWNYLCDNCDIAGFVEYIPKNWANDIGTDVETIEKTFEGLSRGLVGAKEGLIYYIRNFLKHQKNYPLNSKNNSHIGIIKRFENYSHYFNITDIDVFINECKLAPSKPLLSPLGKGNGNDKGISNANNEDFDFFQKKKKINFSQMRGYFIGVEYNNQEKKVRDKYAKNVYDAYCEFLLEFEKYKEVIDNNSFIGIEFFSDFIFKNANKQEITNTINKMCGLPIGRDILLSARFLDVLEMVKSKSNKQEIKKVHHIPHEPTQKIEWWKMTYGDRFKTFEEFEEARIKGEIDPFND